MEHKPSKSIQTITNHIVPFLVPGKDSRCNKKLIPPAALGCEDVFYCSISCQQKDWATHRLACHRHSDQVAQKALSSAVVLPETKDRGSRGARLEQ